MRAPPSLFSLLLMTLLAPLVLGGGTCGNGSPDCLCGPCGTDAINLTVVDGDNGGPVPAFEVEVLLNGTSIGTPEACSPSNRTGARCGIPASGFGVYHLVVGAPGFKVTEKLVRVVNPAPDEACACACPAAQSVEVPLFGP